jgi:hypothetical protein
MSLDKTKDKNIRFFHRNALEIIQGEHTELSTIKSKFPSMITLPPTCNVQNFIKFLN